MGKIIDDKTFDSQPILILHGKRYSSADAQEAITILENRGIKYRFEGGSNELVLIGSSVPLYGIERIRQQFGCKESA